MDYIVLRKNDLTYLEILYKLMVEYIAETDLHQNITTPKELIHKITKSMIDKLAKCLINGGCSDRNTFLASKRLL